MQGGPSLYPLLVLGLGDSSSPGLGREGIFVQGHSPGQKIFLNRDKKVLSKNDCLVPEP